MKMEQGQKLRKRNTNIEGSPIAGSRIRDTAEKKGWFQEEGEKGGRQFLTENTRGRLGLRGKDSQKCLA